MTEQRKERLSDIEWLKQNCERRGFGGGSHNKRLHEVIANYRKMLETWTPPPCDACHGCGFVMTGGSFPGGGWAGSGPCPKGCPPPQTYNGSPTAMLQTPPICDKCGEPYVSIPRLGIGHLCGVHGEPRIKL